jgi:hypothetical protein
MKSLFKKQEITKGLDMKKINGKGEEIILYKVTYHIIKNRDTINPDKKMTRICINFKISVIGVVCMVIGLALVAHQNILQIYIKPL